MHPRPLIAALVACLAPLALTAQQPEWTLLIRNGTVVDGSGMAGYRADVGIVGDRGRAESE